MLADGIFQLCIQGEHHGTSAAIEFAVTVLQVRQQETTFFECITPSSDLNLVVVVLCTDMFLYWKGVCAEVLPIVCRWIVLW